LGEIYAIGHYASRFIKGTKCTASLLGLCDDFMAEPFNRFYPEDRAKVAVILEKLNPYSY
jgi:4-hydroxy-tetrahydrodipicolinate synthase